MTGVKRTDWAEIEAAWRAGESVRQIITRFPDLSPWTLSNRRRLQGWPPRKDYGQRPIRVSRPKRRDVSTSPWRFRAA